MIKERKLRLIKEIPETLILKTDESKMRLVFENLISNAVKYTPIGGKISLMLEKKNKNIEFKIQDTGIGLTEEEKNKIFEKFGKVNKEGVHIVSDGIGIGLYISKYTIELHGGSISVESEGRNKGCTFIVRLPID